MVNPSRSPDQDLQQTLVEILQSAVRALGGSAAVAATWDQVGRRYVVSGSYGIDERELARLSPLLDEAIPDLAESRHQFDLLSELTPHKSLPLSRHGQMQDSIMALPMRIGGNSIGLIFVLRPLEAASFSNLDPPVLAAFADQAAIALQNARLAHLLAQEKQRVESILEGSADGVYMVDDQRNVVGLNSAMERILGRPRSEVLGQPCYRVINLRDWDGRAICPGRCPLLTTPDESNPVVELEGCILSPDQQRHDVGLVYSIVRSPEGQPLNAVVNVRDISRMREMENLRSVFLSMLGHQLQTPLAIIKGYASTLSRTDRNWEEATLRQSCEAIEEETDRLSQLINRLLLVSRLEAGELVLHREPVNLVFLTRRVVGRVEPVTRQHQFVLDFPEELPAVPADPTLLEEVLLNLVDNAVKYSPDGGDITITGQMAGDQVSLVVADQGIGVPWWETGRIFERFHRSANPRTEETRGMGLGLYVSRAVVEAHGGRLTVTSEPGDGSRFTLVLPAAPAENYPED